ncbi:hypothetical protein KIN20_015635 [Parelaphostrongylus tenuis]|uniref:Uncharacterized protein n=1 Tax=Parelaphostrongylus tenuis TaxID=148309 RepID=A0AAD5QQ46_PARTN|nr:hypothetical protein KIN20_015635 [Parelaphostrongylus tenuis]
MDAIGAHRMHCANKERITFNEFKEAVYVRYPKDDTPPTMKADPRNGFTRRPSPVL